MAVLVMYWWCIVCTGFSFLSYKGYEKIDDRASDIGCITALGIALFPQQALSIQFISCILFCADSIFNFIFFAFIYSEKQALQNYLRKESITETKCM